MLQNNDGSQKISGDSLKNVYKSFVADYPIVSIEDPFDQDDWEHYAKMTNEVGEQVQIVGDDLLVTNPKVKFMIYGVNLLQVILVGYILSTALQEFTCVSYLFFLGGSACRQSNQGEELQCPPFEGNGHCSLYLFSQIMCM